MQLKDLIKGGINATFSNTVKSIGNLNSTGLTGAIAAIYEQATHDCTSCPILVICADSFDAQSLRTNLKALLPKTDIEYFSDWETLPYDTLSPHQDIVSSRIKLLAAMPEMSDGIVITTVQALMPRIAPLSFIKKQSFSIKVGDKRDITMMKKDLTTHGYLLVEQVLSPGEFAVRGSIVDIYPMGSKTPYRIDFFDDEVDSLRIFDVDSQRSLEKINSVSMLPAHEFPLDESGISLFRSNYRDAFIGANLTNHPIYQAISKGAIPAGIEYYLPLFFSEVEPVFNYLNEKFKVITVDDVTKACDDFDVDVHKRALEYAGNSDHPTLPAQRVFLTSKEFNDKSLKEFLYTKILLQKIQSQNVAFTILILKRYLRLLLTIRKKNHQELLLPLLMTKSVTVTEF